MTLTVNPQGSYQNLDDWEVEHLRATTFIHARPIDKIPEDKWWEKINEGKPENEQTNYPLGMKMQGGVVGGNGLTVQSQSDRVDWILTAGKQTPNEPLRNTIGSLSDALESLLGVAKRWLNVCPPSNRLAFGAVLVRQVSDGRKGCEEILRFLPNLSLDPGSVSDLIYQINRRRKSMSSTGMVINRISKWSVMQTNTIGLTVSNAGASISPPEQERYARRLDLDINTAPSDRDISTDNTYTIFKELTEYGCEIASKGDVA